ncbi:MAG: SUMF1/EgtB/PvdO family nonheme iron enzyme [Verrucomicrobiales bacterium]|nr:SUMF1/EgtB/PvdO family nonheme iron enzyme [Verrucomicrobiales bacterium]
MDKRFVRLTLLIDQGESAPGPRWQATREFDDLASLLADTPQHPAVVILGAPGTGKSTLLRHHQLETAQSALARLAETPDPPLTFLAELNRYPSGKADQPPPSPLAWLEQLWERPRRAHDLPSLKSLLEERRLTLLLDALNEMPGEPAPLVRRWKEFLAELDRDYPGNRVLFTCRTLDYSASLSSNDLPVPQARLEDLSDAKVREFIDRHSPEHGAKLWANLRGTPQLDLFRTPYYLRLLVDLSRDGEVPDGRASLFTRLIRSVLQRELEKPHPLPALMDGGLLTEGDRRQLGLGRWNGPHQLPERGPLVGRLRDLAFDMQREHPGAKASLPHGQALERLGGPDAEAALEAACALTILDQDPAREDEVTFFHQLLQEYFAARKLAAEFDPELVAQKWRANEVSPNLEETLKGLSEADPLPPLEATGWEETTRLAAAMATELASSEPKPKDAGEFVRAISRVNLPLAARCAADAGVAVPETLKAELRTALIERSRSLQADLRARIAAGEALGELGDPRFERKPGPHGDYLLPPMVRIPAGRYLIGSEDGHADERPVHHVDLAEFEMGQFPVTNAEWRLFMDAGGYEEQRWWTSEEDQAWHRGEGTEDGPRAQAREERRFHQQNPGTLRNWLREGRVTTVYVEDWEGYARMRDEEFDALLARSFPAGRQTQPRQWNNQAFNDPSQPVVGVCWHEVRAYCLWLSAQTGQHYALPTEAQWEAAARGKSGRAFAYGDRFDSRRANTFESHLRRTTPVGIYPEGETPEGISDLTGNVWEWTSSVFRDYPYDPNDGREASKTGASRRVVRGGAWCNDRDGARAAYRDDNLPGARYSSLGFRLVRVSPILK